MFFILGEVALLDPLGPMRMQLLGRRRRRGHLPKAILSQGCDGIQSCLVDLLDSNGRSVRNACKLGEKR